MKGERGTEQQQQPPGRRPTHGRLGAVKRTGVGGGSSSANDFDNSAASSSPVGSFFGAGTPLLVMEAPLPQQQYVGLSLSQLNFNNNNNNAGYGGGGIQCRQRRDTPPSQTSSCTDSVLLQDVGDELQWCADYPFNREFQRHLCSSSMTASGRLMRRSILVGADDTGALGGGVELSYEDLSKKFDANLAEIDMETFRSEDIHAILTLPALYGGDFQSASCGEQCASVSGSFLEALPLDASSASSVQ